MVFEATYLVAVLTAVQTWLCCGQNFAQMSKVFRPINKSHGMFICFLMAVEETGSECGLIHPPYVEHVDIVFHRFGLDGRVVIVGVVNSNQILRHDFSILL